MLELVEQCGESRVRNVCVCIGIVWRLVMWCSNVCVCLWEEGCNISEWFKGEGGRRSFQFGWFCGGGGGKRYVEIDVQRVEREIRFIGKILLGILFTSAPVTFSLRHGGPPRSHSRKKESTTTTTRRRMPIIFPWSRKHMKIWKSTPLTPTSQPIHP